MKKVFILLALLVLSITLFGCDTGENNVRAFIGKESIVFDLESITEFTIVMHSKNYDDVDFSENKVILELEDILSIKLYENGFLRIIYKDFDEVWIRPDSFSIQ